MFNTFKNHGHQGKTLTGALIAAAIVLGAATAGAQGRWESITSANSLLPSDTIASMAVDSTGSVWVSTRSRTTEPGSFIDAGVCRFDGSAWSRELEPTASVYGLVTTPSGLLCGVVFPNGREPRVWRRRETWQPIASDRESTAIGETMVSKDGSLYGLEHGLPEPWFYLYLHDVATGEPAGTEHEIWLPTIGEGTYGASTGMIDGQNALWIVADEYGWVNGTYGRKEGPSLLLSLPLDAPQSGWTGVNIGTTIVAAAGGRGGVSGFAATDGFLVHTGTLADKNWQSIAGVTSAQRVVQDADGNFWVVGTTPAHGTESRLLYYDVTQRLLEDVASLQYPAESITAMVADTRGYIWIGYNGTGVGVWRPEPAATVDDRPASPAVVASVTPNPSQERCALQCTIPGPTRMTIDVYDLLGRHVERIYDGNSDGGSMRLEWDGTGAPGEYCFRVVTRFGTATGRFVLLSGRR